MNDAEFWKSQAAEWREHGREQCRGWQRHSRTSFWLGWLIGFLTACIWFKVWR